MLIGDCDFPFEQDENDGFEIPDLSDGFKLPQLPQLPHLSVPTSPPKLNSKLCSEHKHKNRKAKISFQQKFKFKQQEKESMNESKNFAYVQLELQ